MKKIIRVFPKRTSHTPNDDLSFIGDPPLYRPEADEVHVSCTFTWDKPESERLCRAWEQHYDKVYVGGPAYDDHGNGFMPGQYLKNGITMTSRGCNNQCPWCLAWRREGRIRELSVFPGNKIQDNNLLQCRTQHIDNVIDMLRSQKDIEFSGGLDSRLITGRFADRIRDLKIKQIFFACDTDDSIKPLRKALRLLQLPQNKIRCYVLLKHNPDESMMRAFIRMLEVWEAGCLPFAMLYQPPDEHIEYSAEWKRFARTWSRPAGSRTVVKKLLENKLTSVTKTGKR